MNRALIAHFLETAPLLGLRSKRIQLASRVTAVQCQAQGLP
jgi:hypothetical protein